ncbi:MAG: hypothetical protein PHE25_02770 [Candidatus Gracilibacteria bacterium]|nr:hypothetical protein [Candidatus Gracilibacteria bacterium]
MQNLILTKILGMNGGNFYANGGNFGGKMGGTIMFLIKGIKSIQRV